MKLSAVDLNLLLVLHVVLEERSVTRAARRLHVTPPAVSNSLARLRDLLGDPLLVRSGRGLVPTPLALQLSPGLQQGLRALEGAVTRPPPFVPAEAMRSFGVVCTDSDQLGLLPAVARAFARRMPRATLHVLSVDHLVALGGMDRAEVDAAISPPLPPVPGLHALTLYEDEAVLVVRRGHPVARRRLTAEAFNRLRHIDIRVALGERGEGNKLAEAAFRRQGLVRDVAATVPGFSAALMLAASTDLAAGVPRRLATALAGALSLTVLDIPGHPLRFPMQLVWHERTHADPGSRFLRVLIVEAAR